MDKAVIAEIREHLSREDYGGLLALCERDRSYRKALWLALNEADDQLRYRAVEAVGRLMERWWRDGDTERVREYARRLLWAMNDESGQMVWSAPEAIAEIAALIPDLLDPYASLMVSRAFEEPPLVPSGLRGIARLGDRAREAVAPHEDLVLQAFNSADPRTLGLAAWALGEVRFAPALPYLRALQASREIVAIETRERLPERPLGQWAAEAVAKISDQAGGAGAPSDSGPQT
jgi:hypothetical protein